MLCILFSVPLQLIKVFNISSPAAKIRTYCSVGMNYHHVRSRFDVLVCSNDGVIDEDFPIGIIALDAHYALSSTFWSLVRPIVIRFRVI